MMVSGAVRRTVSRVTTGRRTLTMSTPRLLCSHDMQEADIKRLTVNRERLMANLHETCNFGMGHRWGRLVDRWLSIPSSPAR